MATIPRTYLVTSKAKLNSVPPKNGQVIALYDSDEVWYDAPDNGAPTGEPIRRKISGVKVITDDDLNTYLPIGNTVPMEGIIYVVIRPNDTQETLPDGTPLFDSRVWTGGSSGTWNIVGTNRDDINVKSEKDNSATFYLVGSESKNDSIGTLVKNENIYVDDGVIQGSITHAEDADNATDADHATIADNDSSNQAITSYLRGVTSDYTSGNASTLTFTKGDGSPLYVQVSDTTYSVYTSSTAGLVNGLNVTVGADTTNLILSGDGWIDTGDITIPLADKATNDGKGQEIASTYISGGSYNTSTHNLILTYGDNTSGTPHISTINIPDTTYSVFTTTANGLVPASGANTAKFLRGNGTWDTAITPADVYAGSTAGIVPAAGSGNTGKYLRNDGTWAGAFAISSMGLVPAPTNSDSGKFLKGDATWGTPTDTKNTAGANNSTSKLYLVGATQQTSGTGSEQTYSNSNVYAQNGKLYSNGLEVVTVSGSQNISGKTYESYTLGDACAATVTDTIASDTTTQDTFTGDGTTVAFTLSTTANSITGVLINNVAVATTDYNLNAQGTQVVFDSAPANNDAIEVTYSAVNSDLPTNDAVVYYVSTAVPPIVSSAIADKVNASVIAPAYDNTQTYAVGDYCTYDAGNGIELYICTVAVTTAENFDSAKWTSTTAADNFGSGGGGSSTLSSLLDVSISSVTNNQVLTYNSTSGKWENANASGGSSSASSVSYTNTTSGLTSTNVQDAIDEIVARDVYSGTEHIVGTWIDNNPVYELVYTLSNTLAVGSTSWVATGITISNISTLISVNTINEIGKTCYPAMGDINQNNELLLLACRDNNGISAKYVIIRYTKSSS